MSLPTNGKCPQGTPITIALLLRHVCKHVYNDSCPSGQTKAITGGPSL